MANEHQLKQTRGKLEQSKKYELLTNDTIESGNAWVTGNARVYSNARVFGDAWVTGDAKVTGNAKVSGGELLN